MVEYVEEELEEEEIKEKVTKKFLEGELEYRDFAKVVGMEKAKEIETAKEVLEESIDSAKKRVKKKHDISELKGLGSELWRSVDVDEYIKRERKTWNG